MSSGEERRDRLLSEFLQGFCIQSEDHGLSRGYLDGLPSLLRRADPTSDVAKAATAAALGNAGMRYNRKDLLQEAERVYGSLLKSFRRAIVDLKESTCVTTFMTTVLLGLYEVSPNLELRVLR